MKFTRKLKIFEIPAGSRVWAGRYVFWWTPDLVSKIDVSDTLIRQPPLGTLVEYTVNHQKTVVSNYLTSYGMKQIKGVVLSHIKTIEMP